MQNLQDPRKTKMISGLSFRFRKSLQACYWISPILSTCRNGLIHKKMAFDCALMIGVGDTASFNIFLNEYSGFKKSDFFR